MIEFLSDKDKVYSIGQLYFTPSRGPNGKPQSQYEGVIAGLIVRREDGSEFEVRADKELPLSKIPFAKRDLVNLEIGTKVISVIDGTPYTIIKVFPIYGDIWVKDNDGTTSTKKYLELRRAL